LRVPATGGRVEAAEVAGRRQLRDERRGQVHERDLVAVAAVAAQLVRLAERAAQFSEKLKYPADSLADSPIYGGRIARGIGEYWIIELGGAFGQTHELRPGGGDGDKVSFMNLSASLIAQLPPAGNFGRFYAAAGGGYSQYDSDGAPEDLHYGTFEAALGWHVPVTPELSVRLEARNVLSIPHENW